MAEEYTFSGPQPGYKDSSTHTKGVMRRRKEQKRKEALARNRKHQENLQITEEVT